MTTARNKNSFNEQVKPLLGEHDKPTLKHSESQKPLLSEVKQTASDDLNPPSPQSSQSESESELQSPTYKKLLENPSSNDLQSLNETESKKESKDIKIEIHNQSTQPKGMRSFDAIAERDFISKPRLPSGPNTSTFETGDPRLAAAEKLLQDIENKTRKIEDWEYLIVLLAVVFAGSASSAAHDFSKRFLHEVAKYHNEDAEWAAAIVAGIPQFCLSLKTNIDRWSIIIRSLRTTASIDEIKKHWKDIAITVLSAIPTCKVGRDTEDFKGHNELAYSVGIARSFSALGTNGYFLYNHRHTIKQKEQEAKMPVIRMLATAKKNINSCKDKELIEKLSQSALLRNLNNVTLDPVERVNKIIAALLTFIGDSQYQQTKEQSFKTGQALSFFSGIMNWKAGSKAPELFGLETAKDLLAFINNVGSNPILILSFTIGAGIIGIPSWYVNYLINFAACKTFADKFNYIKGRGFKRHFGEYTFKDWILTPIVWALSAGFGAANGGMAHKYPFINEEFVAIPNAIFSGTVFTALGVMSINNLVDSIGDRRHQYLFLNAIKADNLTQYFDGLSPDHQQKCASLIKKYLTLIVDTQIGFFVDLDPERQPDLISEDNQSEIADKFDNTLTSIRVEEPSNGCCPRLFSRCYSQKPRLGEEATTDIKNDEAYEVLNKV